MVLHRRVITALEAEIRANPGISQKALTRRLQQAGYTITRSSVQRILRDTPERRAARRNWRGAKE